MTRLAKGLSGALYLALIAGMGGTASAQPTTQLCKVTIDRSQPDGVFDVTKVVADDGDCICYAYTGSTGQGKDIEGQVGSLLQARSCDGAKTVNVPKTGAAAGTGAGASSAWAAAATAAAFGAFLKFATDRAEDDQPVSP